MVSGSASPVNRDQIAWAIEHGFEGIRLDTVALIDPETADSARESAIEDALDAFVRSKQKGTDSGNYQRNARRAIEEWIGWLADCEDPLESFDQL